MTETNSQNKIEEIVERYKTFANNRTKEELLDNLLHTKWHLNVKNGHIIKIYKVWKYKIYCSLVVANLLLKTPYILFLWFWWSLQAIVWKNRWIENIKKSIRIFEKNIETEIIIVENS